MNLSNYYEILKISSNSNLQEIKSQYRKLSFNLHPDRNNNPKDNDEYKKITEAYKIIYDYKRNELNNLNENENNNNNNFSNNKNSQLTIHPQYMDENSLNQFAHILLNKFNQSNKLNFNDMPANLYYEICIDIFQAYSGINYPLKINRYIYENFTKREQSETIYIDIPKGIDNNELITLKGKGNKHSNDLIGDIEIKIIINNNSEYTRLGLDLYMEKNISLKDALCGFNFEIKHLNGKIFKICNKPGTITSTNFKKTISNLGFIRDNKIGNLYLNFTVNLPHNLSNEQIKMLNNIL